MTSLGEKAKLDGTCSMHENVCFWRKDLVVKRFEYILDCMVRRDTLSAVFERLSFKLQKPLNYGKQGGDNRLTTSKAI